MNIGHINRWGFMDRYGRDKGLINSPILYDLVDEGNVQTFIDMFTYVHVGIWTGHASASPPYTGWLYRVFHSGDETWDHER